MTELRFVSAEEASKWPVEAPLFISERDWQALHAVLESDSKPNDALRAAAEKYKNARLPDALPEIEG